MNSNIFFFVFLISSLQVHRVGSTPRSCHASQPCSCCSRCTVHWMTDAASAKLACRPLTWQTLAQSFVTQPANGGSSRPCTSAAPDLDSFTNRATFGACQRVRRRAEHTRTWPAAPPQSVLRFLQLAAAPRCPPLPYQACRPPICFLHFPSCTHPLLLLSFLPASIHTATQQRTSIYIDPRIHPL